MATTSGTDTSYTLIHNDELEGLYRQNRELRLEVERLRAKCNALIDALDGADQLSYYPELAERAPSPASHSQTSGGEK